MVVCVAELPTLVLPFSKIFPLDLTGPGGFELVVGGPATLLDGADGVSGGLPLAGAVP